jgi:hypothetical protein
MAQDCIQTEANPGVKPLFTPISVKDTIPVVMIPISIAKTTFCFIVFIIIAFKVIYQ